MPRDDGQMQFTYTCGLMPSNVQMKPETFVPPYPILYHHLIVFAISLRNYLTHMFLDAQSTFSTKTSKMARKLENGLTEHI
jgi:hypothetical protein